MRIAIGVCADAGDCNTNVAQRHAANEMMRMMASRSAKILKRDGLRPFRREFLLFMYREQQCPLWVISRHVRCNYGCPLRVISGHVRRKTRCPLYPQQRPRKRLPAKVHVRFTPKSGHVPCSSSCLLWAKSRHLTEQKGDGSLVPSPIPSSIFIRSPCCCGLW